MELTVVDKMLCAEQLPEGLEQAIMKMKVGEKAEIAIQPQYAFGAEASQQPEAIVPPQSTVVYTLELVDMEKVRPVLIRGWTAQRAARIAPTHEEVLLMCLRPSVPRREPLWRYAVWQYSVKWMSSVSLRPTHFALVGFGG